MLDSKDHECYVGISILEADVDRNAQSLYTLITFIDTIPFHNLDVHIYLTYFGLSQCL